MAVLMVAWRDAAWVDWRVEQSDRRMENRLVDVKVDWTGMPMAESMVVSMDCNLVASMVE